MKQTLLTILTCTALVAAAHAQSADDQPAAKTLADYNLEARTARLKGDLETWLAAGSEGLKFPAIYLRVCAVLALAAVIACWIPARRAARVNPMITLRAE